MVLAFVLLSGLGITVGAIVWHGERQGVVPGPTGPRPGPVRGRPFLGIAVVVGLAALAGTGLAYRRLAGPVGELLEAADRVGAGDYEQRLQPRGPHEVQSLMRTFNEMSNRLEATDSARRQFLADVTHELRTPLSVLQSGIEAQLDGIHPRDDAHLTSLLDETHVLTRVVDDLHTLALAGAGRLTLHRETLDADVAVADAIAAHAASAAARGVTLEMERRVAGAQGRTPKVERSGADAGLPPPDTPPSPAGTPQPPTGAPPPATVSEAEPIPVEADPVRLQQILGNLLGNALRHTPAGGRVTVTVERGDTDSVRFTVADSGPGFPAEQLPGLFERFSKAEESKGSGLGLAIARDLVAAHGGSIEATNRPEGGAAVTFRLPNG